MTCHGIYFAFELIKKISCETHVVPPVPLRQPVASCCVFAPEQRQFLKPYVIYVFSFWLFHLTVIPLMETVAVDATTKRLTNPKRPNAIRCNAMRFNATQDGTWRDCLEPEGTGFASGYVYFAILRGLLVSTTVWRFLADLAKLPNHTSQGYD